MDVETIKTIAVPILKKHGITRAAVFGSYARGEQKKRSDIDLLIGYPSGSKITLFTLVELGDELKKALNKKVDLVTEKGSHQKLSPRFLKTST
ncbi:MAG: nucleotidyltransferase domain-containing protein [Peptococcaceae bacterium]|nr:nucleotidyltransferase domain-containing protein [Peptococcaceae bacterium]